MSAYLVVLAAVGVSWATSPAPASTAASPGESAVGPIRRVTTSEPMVAITFDACATKTQGYSFDRGIYDVLKRERVPATVFVSGRWIDFHPDVMRELASDGGIEFGDHSYDHAHMADLPRARIAEEIQQTEAALARYGRKSVAFRPPFGEWSPQLLQVARERQLATVTWDIASGDPSEAVTAQGMIQTVVANARPGSIVIFHINGRGWKTAEALPMILRGLRQRGFHLVLLSQLFALGPPAPIAFENPRSRRELARRVPVPETTAVPVVHGVLRPIITDNPYDTVPPAPADPARPSDQHRDSPRGGD